MNSREDNVQDAMVEAQRRYLEALSPGADNRLSLFGLRLFVDQARGFLLPEISANQWYKTDEEGRITLTFPPIIGLFTGSSRYLPLSQFRRMVDMVAEGDIDATQAPPISETQQALFWTLLLAEPQKKRGTLTRNLLIISREMQEGAEDRNLFEAIKTAPEGNSLTLLKATRPDILQEDVGMLGSTDRETMRERLHRMLVAAVFGAPS